MRHGQAVARAASDAGRELDGVGESQVQQVAAGLAAAGMAPAAIWSSPYLRARQTATALGDAFGCGVDIRTELEPDEPPLAIADLVAQWSEHAGRLVLVSHMPLVARVIGWLTSGSDDPSAVVALGTAAVACLTGDPPMTGCFRLQWVRAPAAW